MTAVEERKDPEKLIGESLREVAVLMVVFFPLEAWLQNRATWYNILVAFALAGILYYRGVTLESRDGF
jgi:hypothetical protein